MELLNGMKITKNKKGEIWTNITGSWQQCFDMEADAVMELYSMWKRKYIQKNDKLNKLNDVISMLRTDSNTSVDDVIQKELQKEKLSTTLQQLIYFFKEFSFTPNFRFVNTFAKKCYMHDEPEKYIANYFALTDNAYLMSIQEKMQSDEFKEIIFNMTVKPTSNINNRFKLYYGAQGTGKTTQAMLEANNNVMVCHSAMLPSDLMEDFKFDDGKATFTPSALCKAMTEGKTIVLDEINLLPFESLRFLQSILDNKAQFEYKGQTIYIKDGFKIIGTMNLQVNGMTYALPEPLVDRAEDLRCFELTAEQLLSAIM